MLNCDRAHCKRFDCMLLTFHAVVYQYRCIEWLPYAQQHPIVSFTGNPVARNVLASAAKHGAVKSGGQFQVHDHA